MVSWGSDDGKSILKRCRQRDRDKRQTGRQGGHRGVDTEGQKQAKQGRKQIRNMYHTHLWPAVGHVGRHADHPRSLDAHESTRH